MPETIRPTKKQRELLDFIAEFIAENGYSPSYREIMSGLNYNSVATVALHINSLIKRGHLLKRNNSARSLELVNNTESIDLKKINSVNEKQEKWLVEKVDHFFSTAESAKNLKSSELDNLYVLVGSLKVLGLEGAAQSFIPRLTNLKNKTKK